MKQHEEIKNGKELNSSGNKIDICNNLKNLKDKELKNDFKSIRSKDYKIYSENIKTHFFKGENEIMNKSSGLLFQTEEDFFVNDSNSINLFRFFVKNGEHVYARPNDIIMIESCDHLVNVYLACNNKLKKTIRTNTLKDFLLQLPADLFVRINRFCAININRLSGGNCKDQTFEFDFTFSIKLKHALPQTAFKNIGK